MTGYADPELLVGDWIRDTLGIVVREDPNLRHDSWSLAPVAHIQRSPGGFGAPLTIDDVLLDVDVYAATADHARATAGRIWAAVTLDLPLHTFSNGAFVKAATVQTAPFWGPITKGFRRSATYRVILHGLVP